MITTTVLTLVLMTQAPAPTLERPTQDRPAVRMTQKERIAARKAALSRQARQREAAEYRAQQVAAAQAQAAYERALPFLLQEQGQMLQRQSDIERNRALHRLAGAAESEASTYSWSAWSRQGR